MQPHHLRRTRPCQKPFRCDVSEWPGLVSCCTSCLCNSMQRAMDNAIPVGHGGSAGGMPANVIQQVLQLRHPHRIPGTYSALPVCRAWRDSCPTSRQLDLLILLDELYYEYDQLDRVASWLQAYLGAVRGLQLRRSRKRDETYEGNALTVLIEALEQGLTAAPPAASQQPPRCSPAHQLTSLCLDGPSSLLLVAPLLPELLRLQHLEAAVCMQAYMQQGTFCAEDGAQLWSHLPDLSAAEALISFRLNIVGPGYGWIHGRVIVDKRLPHLLPDTLQQLHLSVSATAAAMPAQHLTHLTRLQSLTAAGVDVRDCSVLLSLPSLQQVAITDVWTQDAADRPLDSGLAPLLISTLVFGSSGSSLLSRHLTALTALRSLRLIPPATFNPDLLQQLRGLTELRLEASVHEAASAAAAAACLAHCTALHQLRALSLHLGPSCSDEQQQHAAAVVPPTAVGALTQLTSLKLLLRSPPDWVPWAAAITQLTGLQQLLAEWGLLGVQQQWLAALTALQQLSVWGPDPHYQGKPHLPDLSDTLQQLSSAAPRLQQLVLMPHADEEVEDMQQALELPLRGTAPGLQVLYVVPYSLRTIPAWCWQLAEKAPHLPAVWQLVE